MTFTAPLTTSTVDTTATDPVPLLPLAVGLYANPIFVLAIQVQHRLSRLLIGTATRDAAWLELAADDLDVLASTAHRDADLAVQVAQIARTAAGFLRGWS